MQDSNSFTIYIIFIPLVLLFGIPLIALLVWYTVRLRIFSKRTMPGSESVPEHLENRISQRIQIERFPVKVFDKERHIIGLITNVSVNGICITGLPIKAINPASQLIIELTTGLKTITMNISPKWEKIQYEIQSIGASIDNVPAEWCEFVASQPQPAVI